MGLITKLMTAQVSKNLLLNTFGVDDFNCLEEAIGDMPPSMVEYHLANLSNFDEDFYLNKRDIEKTVNFGEYSIYLDYSNNIYLEVEILDVQAADSLW